LNKPNGIRMKAVIFGLIVSLVGSSIARLFFVVFLILSKISPTRNATQYIYSHSSLILIALLISLLFNFLGGYTASRLTKVAKLRNACLVGFVCELLILISFFGNTNFPIWYFVLILIFTIPVTLLGAKVAIKKKTQ
jgi:hypothetical protein